MDSSKSLKDILQEFSVKHEFIHHGKSGKTTEEASNALAEPNSNIIKSILLKTEKGEYLGVIIRGDTSIDFKKLKQHSSKKFSFASPEEIKEMLGFELGGVPPFAFYLSKISAVVDARVIQNEYIVWAGGNEFTGLKFSPKEFAKFNYEVADVSKS